MKAPTINQIGQYTWEVGSFEVCKQGVLNYRIYDCKMRYWNNAIFQTLEEAVQFIISVYYSK